MPEISIPYDFEPRWYQRPLWSYFQKGGFKKKRGVMVMHRRGGKDLNAINLIATSTMEEPGLYWHLFPTYAQGKKIAWDGKTKTGRSFLSAFPEQLVAGKNNTEMKITLKNNSIYQVVGADKPDSLVGPNPKGIVFSEWSIMNPKIWEFLQPILAENDGWALFIYTPRGRNHGWKMLQMAMNNPRWYAAVMGNDYTKVLDESAIQEMRDSGMSEEMIQQEVFCSFDAPLQGSYYGKLMEKAEKEGRITNVPYESRLPVHTAWDLGVGDTCNIWFYQVYGFEIRVIDHYENNGEGFAHYAKVLRERNYVYGRHYAPHDIDVREISTAKTRWQTAKDLGIKFEIGKQLPIDEGIEAVRALLPRCYFDKAKCENGLEALKMYHKEYDEDKMLFKDKPCHDWASHCADAFRELSLSVKDRVKHQKKPQEKALSEYDLLKA
jgi:hypothetical protein